MFDEFNEAAQPKTSLARPYTLMYVNEKVRMRGLWVGRREEKKNAKFYGLTRVFQKIKETDLSICNHVQVK